MKKTKKISIGKKKKLSSKKPKNLLDISYKKSIKEINYFNTTSFPIFLYLIHLKLKYNNFELLILNDPDKLITLNYLGKTSIDIDEISGYLVCSFNGIFLNDHKKQISIHKIKKLIKNLYFKYKKENGHRFLILPIMLLYPNSGHANILIIDFKNKTAEYFEPHGGLYSKKYSEYDKNLQKLNKEKNSIKLRYICIKKVEKILNNLKFKLILPFEYMNDDSFQSLELKKIFGYYFNTNVKKGDLEGYCAVWCLWYISLRLKYPDRKPKTLVNETETIIKKNTTFRRFIRNYSKHCYTMTEKLKKKYNTKKKLFDLLKENFTMYNE